MFDSKISAIKNINCGQLSSLQTSNAPGFVPISCPSHPVSDQIIQQYAITNICKSISCIEPLCPECITAHVQLHQQTKKPAKIQNIINTRLTCIQQLAQIKFQTQTQLEKQKNYIQGNIDKYIQQNSTRLSTIKKKINKIIQEFFQDHLKKMDIISNSFHIQKQKRIKDSKLRLAPLQDHFQKISNYKQELQSDDYIPALLQLLNQPPKKPTLSQSIPIQNCGSVEVNQKYIQQFKTTLEKIVKVTINANQNTSLSLNRTNYHSSNNMKFSRLQQSRSNQSKLLQSRQTSKKRIFDEVSSVCSQYIQTPKNVIPITSFDKVFYTGKYKIMQPNNISYFKNPQLGSLVYFEENSKNYYKANLNYAEAGFQKIIIQGNFIVPKKHRSIVTPQNYVYLIGGEDTSQLQSPCLKNVFKIQSYTQNCLEQMTSMKLSRSEFGVIYYKQNLYVFGGITNPPQNQKNKSYSSYMNKNKTKQYITDKCQKYDIYTNKWTEIKNMVQPSYNMKLCALNDKIIKFGGVSESQNLYRIDVYTPQLDSWTVLNLDQCMVLNLKAIGVCEISNTQILIFGGMNMQGLLSNKCFLMSENSEKGIYEMFDSLDLYHQASFQQSYMFKGGVMAIQNGLDNRKRLIMNFRNGQWRFIGC